MNALYLADQARKDVEVGRHVARMGVWPGKPEGKNYFEDVGVDGRTKLIMVLKEIGFDAVVWIALARDRERRRDEVMKLQVPYNARTSLIS